MVYWVSRVKTTGKVFNMGGSSGRRVNKPGEDVRDISVPGVKIPWEVWSLLLDRLGRYGYIRVDDPHGTRWLTPFKKYVLDLIVKDVTGEPWYGSELERQRKNTVPDTGEGSIDL